METTTKTKPGPFAAGPIAAPDPSARDPRFDNQPPLEDRILMDFVEDVKREGIAERIDELVASAARAPGECGDATIAGAMGDLCKQARAISVKLEAAREKHNRQLIDARGALKARADNLIAPLDQAIAAIRKALDDWTAREKAKADEAQRIADAQARAAEDAARKVRDEQEAAERARLAAMNIPEAEIEQHYVPPPEPVFEAPKIAAPMARGNLGSSVGSTTVWNFEIESIRQVPDRYLKHAKVREALESVIRTAIRTEKIREIKGVKIWSGVKAAVR